MKIKKYGYNHVVKSVSGDWKGNKANEAVKWVLESELDFDLVFAHNDVMAKEAYNVVRQFANKQKIYILGVDGLSGNRGGIQMVLDNVIDATFFYQTGGGLAIQTANNILNNKRISKQNVLPTITIDKTNALVSKSLTDKIELLHNRIERQKLLLSIEIIRNNTKRLILFFLIAVLALATVLVILIYLSLRNKKKANYILTKKNIEIEQQNKTLKEQQEQLIKISKELEEATQVKLTFFTNISHEFKTPLTLIKGPIENLIKSDNNGPERKRMYKIMHRNTVLLLQMINQLMDFRKLGNNKLTINATENNLNDFIQEIFDSFKTFADNRNIDFSFKTNLIENNLWFDIEKIGKVLYNLLSNAFKFTPEGGKITISVMSQKVEYPGLYSKEICITIADTGIGIQSKNINKVFIRFYHNGESKIVKGTGIGLNFSKKLVELHRGKITFKSIESKGTTFSVFLSVGNKHLLEEEMAKQDLCNLETNGYMHEIPECNKRIVHEKESLSPENASLILIVEDTPDVMEFIRFGLGNDFRITTAKNGKEGIQKVLDEEPDLIISDVMMPEMDGFELTRKLKSELETSHIPIILITARTALEVKIKGIEGGADSFIEKPFNSSLLKTQVLNLLKSREKLREHYRTNLNFKSQESDLTQLDKKLLAKLKKNVLQNIGNKDMSVDELGQFLGISRVHLYRKVKKLTDMSVSEFVISIKLKKSLEYLRKSGKTITEIAYESGFSSQSYYTRCFKYQFKISPSDYIKQYRNED
ncbi:MAG: response regulator [Bacteroidetes bacterium]|nr:response regulator [Bacteroidota bacterium]